MPIRSMDRSIRLMVVVFLVVTIPSSLMATERSIFPSDGSWLPPSLVHSARLRVAKHARVTLSVPPAPNRQPSKWSSPPPPSSPPSPPPPPPPSPPPPPPPPSPPPPPPPSPPPGPPPSPPPRTPPSPPPPQPPPSPPPPQPPPSAPGHRPPLPPPLPPPARTAPPKDSGASTSNKKRTGKDLGILFLVIAGVMQVGVASFLFLLRRRKPEKGKDSNGRLVG